MADNVNQNVAILSLMAKLEDNSKDISAQAKKMIGKVEKTAGTIEFGADTKEIQNAIEKINKLIDGKLKGIDLTKQFGSILKVFSNVESSAEDYLNILDKVHNELDSISKLPKNSLNLMSDFSPKQIEQVLKVYDKLIDKQEKYTKKQEETRKKAQAIEAESLLSLKRRYNAEASYKNASTDGALSLLSNQIGLEDNTSAKQDIKEYSQLLSIFDLLQDRKKELATMDTAKAAEEEVQINKNLLNIINEITIKEKRLASAFGAKDLLSSSLEGFDTGEINLSILRSIDEYATRASKVVKDSVVRLQNELDQTILDYSQKNVDRMVASQEKASKKVQTRINKRSSSISTTQNGVQDISIANIDDTVSEVTSAVQKLDNALENIGDDSGSNELDLWAKSAENLKEEFADVIKYAVDAETAFNRLNEIWKKYDKGLSITQDETTEMWGLMKRLDELELNGLSNNFQLNEDQIDEFREWEDDDSYSKLFNKIQDMTEKQLAEIEKLKVAQKEVTEQPISDSSSTSALEKQTEKTTEAIEELVQAEKEVGKQSDNFTKPSQEILELVQRVETLESSLSDMQNQLNSLNGEAFEKMKNDISDVKKELDDAVTKIKELNANSGASLEDKLSKEGLTVESATAMAQYYSDLAAIDDKTGIYTEWDNVVETVTAYHEKIKETNAYLQKGNDIIEERAILLKNGKQVGEEYVMSDATGKVDIGNGIKKYDADSVLHTHAFDEKVNNLRFSDADIQELVDGTVKKALLLCGDEIATLDMSNVSKSDFEPLKNDILGAYTAVFARFGAEVKDGKLVGIDTLPPEIQNQATDIVNNLLRGIMQNYGGDLVFDKIDNNELIANDDARLPKIDSSEIDMVQKYIGAITSDKPAENIIALQKQFGVLKSELQEIQQEAKETATALSDVNQSSVLSGNQTEVLSGDAKQAIEAQQKLQDELDETKEKIITLYRGISKDFVIGDLQVKTPHNNYGTFFSDTLKNSLQAYTGISKQDDKIIYKLELPESILNKMLQIDAKGKSYSDVDTDGLAEQYSKDGKTIGYVVKNCIDGIEELQTTVSIFDEKLLATAKLMSSQEIKDSGVHNYNFSDYFQEYSTSSTLEDEKSALLEIQKIINSIQKGKPIDFPITDDHESFVKSLKYLEALRNNLIELGYRWNDNEDNTYSIIPIDDHAITNGEEMKRILVDINSLSPKVNQTPLSSPLFEDESSQLSFVEQTKKSVDLIEEESGQMSMFGNVADKATDSAIEGQMTLNDILNKNIEGQMNLNDLAAKQDTTAPVVEPIKDTFDADTSATSTEQHTSDIKAETDAIEENTQALKENQKAQESQSKSKSKNKEVITNPSKEGFKAPTGWVKDVNKAWDNANSENAIKNYEELINKVERYYSLLAKNKSELTNDEESEFKSLQKQIENATKSLDEFNGKGKDFNEIVKKFKTRVGELDEKSGLTDLYGKDGRNDVFNQLSSDEVVSSKINGYEQKVNDLKTVFLEIKNLVPIDITNQKEVDRLDELNKQFDELAQNLNSDKYDPANQSDINKWTGKISDTLFKNTNAPKEIRRDMEALVEQLKQVGLSQADIRRIKEEFERLESQMKATGKTGDSLGTKIKKKFKDVAAYFATYVSIQDAIQVIRQGFETIKEYDKALTEMNKVSDESIQTLKEFQEESFGLADSVGTTASQIQNSTADWMRLGESLEQAKQSAKDANVLLNVSEFGSIDEATESLVAMSAAYDDLEKMEIVDVMNEIGNNYAISTDELSRALQRSAGTLKVAGNDIYEATALVTAGNAVLQDAEAVGTGLKMISLRILGTEQAKDELASLGEDVDDFVVQTKSKLDETIRNYTAVTSNNFEGISVLDDNGNYKSTYEILRDISQVYQEILETDKKAGTNRGQALLEVLAGFKSLEIWKHISKNIFNCKVNLKLYATI